MGIGCSSPTKRLEILVSIPFRSLSPNVGQPARATHIDLMQQLRVHLRG